MNKRLLFNTIGKILILEAVFFGVPPHCSPYL